MSSGFPYDLFFDRDQIAEIAKYVSKKLGSVIFLTVGLSSGVSGAARTPIKLVQTKTHQNFRLKFLRPQKLLSLLYHIQAVTPEMIYPEVTVTEITVNPSERHLLKGSVDERFNIRIPFVSRVYPIFVHEVAHTIFQATLTRDLPEYNKEKSLAIEIEEVADKYRQVMLLKSTGQEGLDPLIHTLYLRWRNLIDIRKVEGRCLSETSRYFEEIYADLMISIIYHKKPHLVDNQSTKGIRNLSVLIKPEIEISGDPHYALQKLAAHIYVNYLNKTNSDSAKIIQNLYLLARSELKGGVASGWLKPGGILALTDADGVFFLGGRNFNEYVDELIQKYDKMFENENLSSSLPSTQSGYEYRIRSTV